MPFDPLIDAGYKHGEFSRGPSAGLRVELQDHHSYRDSTPGPCRIDLVQCDAVLELQLNVNLSGSFPKLS